MKPQSVSEYMTDIFIGWMMPTLFGGFFAILLFGGYGVILFGGYGVICAVMAFSFAVTFIVQQIGLLLNFSDLSIHISMAVSCFFSLSFAFHRFCEWRFKLNQKS